MNNKITIADCFEACKEAGYSIRVDGHEIDFVEICSDNLMVGLRPSGIGELYSFDKSEFEREALLNAEGKIKMKTYIGTMEEVEFQFLKIVPLPLGELLERKLKDAGNTTGRNPTDVLIIDLLRAFGDSEESEIILDGFCIDWWREVLGEGIMIYTHHPGGDLKKIFYFDNVQVNQIAKPDAEGNMSITDNRYFDKHVIRFVKRTRVTEEVIKQDFKD